MVSLMLSSDASASILRQVNLSPHLQTNDKW